MWERRPLHELLPHCERERERAKKKTWDDCDNLTHWKLIRKPLGTSGLKEGADVAV
jgi:hypothetical protein